MKKNKKIKFNKNQKKIMRIGASFLFALALILILNIVFNAEDYSKKYIGKWSVGYNIYDGTSDNIVSKFIQELYIVDGGTFYTKVDGENATAIGTPVSGTYECDENKITLTFEQLGNKKSQTLYIKDNRLCINDNCDQYYEKGDTKVYYNFAKKSGDSN